jgi:hypothetical protein
MKIPSELTGTGGGEPFAPGEFLYLEGEPGSLCFLILEGEVALERGGERVERVGAGAIAGEEALFDGGRRTHTARALTHVRALPVSRASYEFWTRHAAELGAEVESARARRTARLGGALALAALALAAPATAQLWPRGNRLLTSGGGALASAAFGSSAATGDFDGDGYDDLAVGEPLRPVSGLSNAGLVTIWKGSADGLGAAHHQTLQYPQAGGAFGQTLAAGDFDGDGDDELVVGLPNFDETFDSIARSQSGFGIVYQWNGDFLVIARYLSQAPLAVPSSPEAFDRFGAALAAGDFDGDGDDDLAVGVAGESFTLSGVEYTGAGAVTVFYGSATGLADAGSQLWFLGSNLPGTPGANDGLGSALAAGDFDGDGFDELAIGAPYRQVYTYEQAGMVFELFGSANGLAGPALALQEDTGGMGLPGPYFHFGGALAAGDFDRTEACLANGSCRDDLAIASPGSESGEGRVFVLEGNSYGLNANTAAIFDQGDLGGGAEADDGFGSVLAAGRIQGGPAWDLALGTPLEDTAVGANAGLAHLAYGGPSGIGSGPGAQTLTPVTGWASYPPAADDRLGTALAIGDFDGSGHDDLAIGMKSRDVSGQSSAGAVQLLYGALFADGFAGGHPCAWSAVVGTNACSD